LTTGRLPRRALLLAALLAAACAGSAGKAGGARLSAEPSSFDFGSVLAGKTLQRDIVLRNVGGAELLIHDVSTTCDCTVVGSYANRLAPGTSTSLRIQLTTPPVAGRTEQRVAIETNDPDRPRVEIEVAATVVAPAR
jgi:hypothetical protein